MKLKTRDVNVLRVFLQQRIEFIIDSQMFCCCLVSRNKVLKFLKKHTPIFKNTPEEFIEYETSKKFKKCGGNAYMSNNPTFIVWK